MPSACQRQKAAYKSVTPEAFNSQARKTCWQFATLLIGQLIAMVLYRIRCLSLLSIGFRNGLATQITFTDAVTLASLILINLGDNAIKLIEHGSITIIDC
jgi:hypothetical protein